MVTIILGLNLMTDAALSQSAADNDTPIDVPGDSVPTLGPAFPYPSEIEISNVVRPISRLSVSLHAVRHSFVGDLDVLLEAPNGQTVVLMSDTFAVVNGPETIEVTITLDDCATQAMPAQSLPLSRSFRPTNFGGGDTWPAPAPPGPHLTRLSSLDGASANGTWRLWIVDDQAADTGSVERGWSMKLFTSNSSCTIFTDGFENGTAENWL